MIIYNQNALIIVVFAISICYLLYQVHPVFFDLSSPYFWSVILAIAGIGEGIGSRSKLYYLPMWLITVITLGWRAYSNYGFFGFNIFMGYAAIFIVLGIGIRMKIVLRKWRSSVRLFDEFHEGLRKIEHELLTYLPNHIYPPDQLSDKYFEPLYTFFQNKWFSKAEVKNHYLRIIDTINKEQSSMEEIKKTAHLRSILEKEITKGVDKYLIKNLREMLDELDFSTR